MIDNVLTWVQTGNNAVFSVVLFLVLWIFYEYVIDFVLRLPRVFVIIGVMYFVLKTFFGLPL